MMGGNEREFEDKIDDLMQIDEEVEVEFGTVEEEDIIYPSKMPEILGTTQELFMDTGIDHFIGLCEDKKNYMKVVSGFTYLCSISEGRFKERAIKMKEDLKAWYKESK